MSALGTVEEVGLVIGREYTLFAEGDCAALETFYTCVSFTGADYLFGYRKSDLAEGDKRVFAGQFTLRNDADSERLQELFSGLDVRGVAWRVS
jgi:hypothetical protein